MITRGITAYVQLIGDLFIGKPLQRQMQNLSFLIVIPCSRISEPWKINAN